MKYRIILASGSPRRKEILTQIGADYEVIVSDCEENAESTEPDKLVKELSGRKAAAVAEKVSGAAVVLGADTVVSFEGKILGKPKDKEDAERMIAMLAGKTHQVYTGVSLIIKEENGESKTIAFAECSEVRVEAMTKRQIAEYVATGESADKAGAYAVQGMFAPHIGGIRGDYYNIVGLPVAGIYKRLYEIGIDLRTGEKIF